MKAAMLREWQTVNQAGLSPHDVHCHQYLAISRYLTDPPFSGVAPRREMVALGSEAGTMDGVMPERKYSPAQLNALAVLANCEVEVGMEVFSGISRQTCMNLEKMRLVMTKGVQLVRWTVTAKGQAEVDDLRQRGLLVSE
jgi:hypothetical protein